MRRIKKKEFENGIRYCTYCKSKGKMKEHAIYRRSTNDLACELHKPIMVKAQAEEDRLDGLGESEGEYQARQFYEATEAIIINLKHELKGLKNGIIWKDFKRND